MKKIIILLFFVIVVLVILNEKEIILIPEDAIRFRVIANSDEVTDQKLKTDIKNNVERELFTLIKDAKSSKEARDIINNNLDKVDNIVSKYNVSYDINYGNNYFPEKTYKGINYEAGNYESLVITLGSGSGKNWWCVLFPPLCLLDEQKNISNYEYELYANQIIDSFKK